MGTRPTEVRFGTVDLPIAFGGEDATYAPLQFEGDGETKHRTIEITCVAQANAFQACPVSVAVFYTGADGGTYLPISFDIIGRGRVCVLARTVRVHVEPTAAVATRVSVSLADGYSDTRNVVIETLSSGVTETIAVPPGAQFMFFLGDFVAAAQSGFIAQVNGPAAVYARMSVNQFPAMGLPVAGANSVTVTAPATAGTGASVVFILDR